MTDRKNLLTKEVFFSEKTKNFTKKTKRITKGTTRVLPFPETSQERVFFENLNSFALLLTVSIFPALTCGKRGGKIKTRHQNANENF